MIRPAHSITFLLCLCVVTHDRVSRATDDAVAKNDRQNFEKTVQPILAQNCVKCHGGEKTRADLDLSALDNLLVGSRSGPIIQPGKAAQSLIVQVLQADHETHMPPGKQLVVAEIDGIKKWIDDL